MQIKVLKKDGVRTGKLQLLRSEYMPIERDAERRIVKGGRGKQKSLGIVSTYTRPVGEDWEKLQLTQAEAEQLTEYYDAVDAENAAMMTRLGILSCAADLAKIADLLENNDVDNQKLLEVMTQVERIKKALHKHGVKKKDIMLKKEVQEGANQLTLADAGVPTMQIVVPAPAAVSAIKARKSAPKTVKTTAVSKKSIKK